MTRIAVVIPFYNGSATIGRALASIRRQTLPAHEVIVVDDGSAPAETLAIAKLAKSEAFQLIRQENGGQGAARNAGALAASSDYICFLDQDDYYLDHHNSVLALGIAGATKPLGWIYADLMEADGEGRICRTSLVKQFSSCPKVNVYNLLANDMYVLPSASLVARDAFIAVGGFDTQFRGYEDDDLFLRLFRAGFSNTFIDQPVAVWCINNESTSFSFKMSESRFRYFEKLRREFVDNDVRGIHIVRDCLVPRFERSFVEEARRAVLSGDATRDAKLYIFNRYKDVVLATPSVSRNHKRRLGLIATVLNSKSHHVVRLASPLFAYKIKPRHTT